MIDTLHLFPETYDLMEKARDFFGLHENGRIFRFVLGRLRQSPLHATIPFCRRRDSCECAPRMRKTRIRRQSV